MPSSFLYDLWRTFFPAYLNLWPYGIVFCLFYLTVLLWQLPVAVLTFWKSEWGTRNTAADVAAQEKVRYEQKTFVMPAESAAPAETQRPADSGRHGAG